MRSAWAPWRMSYRSLLTCRSTLKGWPFTLPVTAILASLAPSCTTSATFTVACNPSKCYMHMTYIKPGFRADAAARLLRYSSKALGHRLQLLQGHLQHHISQEEAGAVLLHRWPRKAYHTGAGAQMADLPLARQRAVLAM